MSKFNCFLLTVALSFFSVFLFKSESGIYFKTNTPIHHFKIDQSINACALSINNSYEELITFEKQKRLASGNSLNSIGSLSEALLDNNSNYLKACNLLDVNLTPSTIIYPFHSFL